MALQKVMKQGRMFLQFITCSMDLYLTIQYQGECGYIQCFSRVRKNEDCSSKVSTWYNDLHDLLLQTLIDTSRAR